MYSFNSRVRYSEVDEEGKCSLVAILNFFQDCCTFEAEDRGVGLEWLGAHRTAWVLTGWQVQVQRRPVYCENLKITTWACGFKLFRGKRNFTIESLDTGELLVYAYSDWAYVNIDTGVPARGVPEKELEAYGMADPLDKEFKKGKLIVDENLPEAVRYTVSEAALDTHHHLNNVNYLKYALDALQLKTDINIGDIKYFRAEYKKQSVLGDVLVAAVSEGDEEGSYLVSLSSEDRSQKLLAQFII